MQCPLGTGQLRGSCCAAHFARVRAVVKHRYDAVSSGHSHLAEPPETPWSLPSNQAGMVGASDLGDCILADYADDIDPFASITPAVPLGAVLFSCAAPPSTSARRFKQAGREL